MKKVLIALLLLIDACSVYLNCGIIALYEKDIILPGFGHAGAAVARIELWEGATMYTTLLLVLNIIVIICFLLSKKNRTSD